MSDPQQHRNTLTVPALAVATLALMWLASFFPHARLGWGLGTWSHIPWPFLAAASLAVIALTVVAARSKTALSDTPLRFYWPAAAIVVTVFTAMYALFPAQTHFLGDGYQVLAQAGDGTSQVKLTAWGEGIVRVWLSNLMSVKNAAGALTVYRTVAAVAGCPFLLAAAFTAARLYNRSSRSLLFLLGLATGSWTLLYFGYVEHYALFVTTVGIYVLAGLLALHGDISRWWVAALAILAAVLHIFGVVLLVPTLYLLLADTAVAHTLTRLSWRSKTALLIFCFAIAVGAAAAIRGQNYVLLYSLLPLFGDTMSYDRYAVLSLRHVIDLLYLLLLLLPAVPLVAALILFPRAAKPSAERTDMFLLLSFFAAFGAAVLLDPKLGMPRDWDLFSFTAIPVTVLLYLVILRRPDPARLTLAVAAVAISLFALSGRVIALNIPDTGAERFKDYISFDHQRHLRSWYHLVEFYKARGDSARVEETRTTWNSLYPERAVFYKGYAMRRNNRPEAAKLFAQAIAINPTYSDAWVNLGENYVSARMFDTALVILNTALRLNPDEGSAHSNMGVAYLAQGRTDRAIACLHKAYALAPTEASVPYNLALAYLSMRREDEFARYLKEAAALPSAMAGVHLDLGDWYLRRGDYAQAGGQYSLALAKGENPSAIDDRIRRFPPLAPHIRTTATPKTD